MVCNRCKMVVKDVLLKVGLDPISVELGEVILLEKIDAKQKVKLNEALISYGFVLIDDKKSRIIEKIKNELVNLVLC